MVAVDPFLPTLDVMVDDFCQTAVPPATPPGPAAARSRSETGPLALCGPWQGVGSARGVDRSAPRPGRPAFPPLPPREQGNRQGRQPAAALGACWLSLGWRWAAQPGLEDALARAGLPTRAAQRRGAGGWPGLAERGWSTWRGWEAGCPRLRAVPPGGVSTGLGLGPARPQAQPWAATGLALRRQAPPGRARGGAPARGPSGVAKGVEGQATQRAGWSSEGAQGMCPPKRPRKTPWPKGLRRWGAGGRQRGETGYEQLPPPCRLARARPPEISGFQGRWAATIALHHCCIWLHEQLGWPRRAFTDVLDW